MGNVVEVVPVVGAGIDGGRIHRQVTRGIRSVAAHSRHTR